MTSVGPRVFIERGIGAATLVVLVVAPLLFSDYFLNSILTYALFLGVVAASLIFLSAYGGMVSLAQVTVYGIAGFVLGNVVTGGDTKGLNLGWNPWWGVLLGIVLATAIGLVFGALAGRSTGIYFLMITLTFAVIANYFFGQVTDVSGFGGISNILAPNVIGNVNYHHNRLYYIALVVALFSYVLIKYVSRTTFGVALQGVRDDPVRMSSLGYNVWLHRTLAFGFGGFIASLGGVLFVWWNGHIDPASIDIGATLDVLIVAVIGGLSAIEGAWIGALAFVVINSYVRDVELPIVGGSFHTIIGLIFLGIVLVSPDGIVGIWDRAMGAVFGRRRGGPGPRTVAPQPAGPGAGTT